MTQAKNREIHLVNRPSEDNFKFVDSEIPSP